MRRALITPLVALLTAGLLLGGGLGFAASLAIAPERLSVFTSASAVPVSTCTLTASADTYVDQGSAGSNFGTGTTLTVRSAVTLVLLPNNSRSLVRFDLASCSIPTSARVLSAQMKLRLSTAPSASRTYDVHAVTQSWAETTVTWNNQPSTAASATAAAVTGTTSDVTLEWDVLGNVAAFVAGTATNHGWRVKDRTEGSSTAREGRFNSREHANTSQRPTLVVTYYP